MRVAHYLVGKEGDLCNLSGLSVGEEEPPVEAVVVVEIDQDCIRVIYECSY